MNSSASATCTASLSVGATFNSYSVIQLQQGGWLPEFAEEGQPLVQPLRALADLRRLACDPYWLDAPLDPALVEPLEGPWRSVPCEAYIALEDVPRHVDMHWLTRAVASLAADEWDDLVSTIRPALFMHGWQAGARRLTAGEMLACLEGTLRFAATRELPPQPGVIGKRG